MTAVLVAAVAVAVALIVLAVTALAPRLRRPVPSGRHPVRSAAGDSRRILFPFMASALSGRALDAALRLARAEEAVLVPVFLARVPLTLPLEAPLPRQAGIAIELQEAIEQRAATFGIAVDARVERGRTHRHALRRAISTERCHRIVVAAATRGGPAGFGPDDVAWLLAHAAGEIVVLRPDTEDDLATAPPRAARAGDRHQRVGIRSVVAVASDRRGHRPDREPGLRPAARGAKKPTAGIEGWPPPGSAVSGRTGASHRPTPRSHADVASIGDA